MEKREVRTAYGSCWLSVAVPFSDGKILFALEDHVFGAGETARPVRAGVAYMRHRGHMRDSGGAIEYVLVEDGLFSLERMCRHINRGTRRDTRDLSEILIDMRVSADFLRMSGRMTEEELEQIIERVKILEGKLTRQKRQPAKLNAGSRLRQSRVQRKKGMRHVAPAARTSYVAASVVNEHLNALYGMSSYFSSRSVDILRIIDQYHGNVERLWKTLKEAPVGTRAVPPPKDFTPILRAMAEHVPRFRGMACQPYRDVAMAIVTHLEWFEFELGNGCLGPAQERLDALVRLLRRLRMIHYVEMDLAASLTMDRGKRFRQSPDDFRARFARAANKFRGMPMDFDPGVFRNGCAALNRIENLLTWSSPRSHLIKAALRDLIRALARVEDPPRPRFPVPVPSLARAS